MAQRVGTRRLQRILAARIDPRTLPVLQEVEIARGMLRRLRAPGGTPKQARPRCQARCRDGHPCQARAVWDADRDAPRNGRCRVHGGVSTGPTSLAGRQRIRASNTRRAQRPRLAPAQAAPGGGGTAPSPGAGARPDPGTGGGGGGVSARPGVREADAVDSELDRSPACPGALPDVRRGP